MFVLLFNQITNKHSNEDEVIIMIYLAKDFRVRRINKEIERKNRIIWIKKKIILSSMILILLFLSGFYITTHADANNIQIVSHQVQSGDTLWEIASMYEHGNKDIREYIYNIKEINNLKSGLISTGQILDIPIFN